ncbi:MAG: hypothetical protein ACSHX7_12985 [Luteolibacter sp.]
MNILTENVREMGGTPATESGAWGVFAKAVQSASNLFGEESAIESLQRGEEHGCEDYKSALEKDEIMDCCKTMIREKLLPKVESHVKILETLEEIVD